MSVGRHDPLPNLLVIGAQKCGTTSLHAYLTGHPDIFMAPGKELDFFIRSDEALPTMSGNWGRGLDWYRSQFDDAAATIRGESSPNYTAHPIVRGVPDRAAAVVPEAKLIYLVRDPVERVVSHYVHQVAAGLEVRSIDEALAGVGTGAPNGYLYRSMYFMQLRRWLDAFPEEALLVLDQEDLRRDRLGTLRSVFSFVGVDPSATVAGLDRLHQLSSEQRSAGALERRLRGGRLARVAARAPRTVRHPLSRAVRVVSGRRVVRPVMSEASVRALRAALEDDVAALRRLTGRPFADWSV